MRIGLILTNGLVFTLSTTSLGSSLAESTPQTAFIPSKSNINFKSSHVSNKSRNHLWRDISQPHSYSPPLHDESSLSSTKPKRSDIDNIIDDRNEIQNDVSVGVIPKKTVGSKSLLAGIGISYLSITTTFAKFDLLGSYTDGLIARDLQATVLCTVLAFIFVKLITSLCGKGIIEPRDSRKIIHMCSAPLFMLLWPLFSNVWGSRIFAAFVPAIQAFRLLLAGTGRGGADENELAGAISRSGNAREALKGPFIYVIILFSSIILDFRDNLAGVIALSTMAAGDGIADLLGRRFGANNKWPFSTSKSVAGSVAFVIAATLCSCGLSLWLTHTGAITLGEEFGWTMATKIGLISIISAAVELVPVGDDNWTVPIVAAGLSLYFI